MLTITQISTPTDIAEVGALVREFTQWAISLDPDTSDAPAFDGLEQELASLPGKFGPPNGCFLLARDDGHPVGCVAFLAHGDDTVEVKRMYVCPDQRGKRVGQQLVSALIAEARRQDNRRIILDSYHTMTSAHKIYRSAGFRDIPAPSDFPEQFRERVVFMDMDLGSGP
jgi:GNAT superfamily N-acetyltransferase